MGVLTESSSNCGLIPIPRPTDLSRQPGDPLRALGSLVILGGAAPGRAR